MKSPCSFHAPLFAAVQWQAHEPWSHKLLDSLNDLFLSGEMSRILQAVWKSDLDQVVLEIPQEGSKICKDSEPGPWRLVLHQMETIAEVVDATINSHDLTRETVVDGAALTNEKCHQCVDDGTVICFAFLNGQHPLKSVWHAVTVSVCFTTALRPIFLEHHAEAQANVFPMVAAK